MSPNIFSRVLLLLCVGLLSACGAKNGQESEILKHGGEYVEVVYTYIDGKKSGVAKYYFNAFEGEAKSEKDFVRGALLCDESWLAGELHGETVVYLRTGEVFARYSYREGRSHGVGRQYFPDGKIADERSWVEGKLEGAHKIYYPSGNIKEEINYKKGKKEGLHRSWYDKKSRLESELGYRNNKRHGIFNMYYKTGERASKQEYRDGSLVGTSRSFYRDGSRMEEIDHEDPKNGYRAWDASGKALPKGEVLDISEMQQ